MSDQAQEMAQRAKPLAELIARRPEAAELLREAAKKTGHEVANLTYLPLTSSKDKDWVALFDRGVKMVGYAPVDGFIPIPFQ